MLIMAIPETSVAISYVAHSTIRCHSNS